MSAFPPDCDQSLAHPGAGAASPQTKHPRLVLAATILASSLAFIDGSVVNVGLPAIGGSFDAGGADLSWVVNGYLLPLSALLLTGGSLGDRYGRRLMLIWGIGLFSAASILCALAPGLVWLVAGRVLQGVGAAMLMPNSLAILGASFSGEARGRAIGTWAAVGAAAGAAGPLLGGWLIDGVGWRAIFFINLPIAAAAIAIAARYVHDAPAPQPAPLDMAGAVLATAGLGALTWGLTVTSAAKGVDLPGLTAIAAGVCLLIAFILVEWRRRAAAMLPLALFKSSSFIGLTILTLLLYGALGGLLVLVPYVLIKSAGYTATAAGAAMLPFPIILALASPTMGRIAGKIGPRLLLTAGPMIVAVGFLLAMRIGGPGGYWLATLPSMLVIAVGMAGAVAPLTTAVLASVEPEHTGVASGFNSAVARTGGLIATALLGAALAAEGDALGGLFRLSMAIGAAAAFAAGVSAFVWLKAPRS